MSRLRAPGYRHTNVGVIPEDWLVVCLGQLGVWKGGATPSMRNSAYWEKGTIPWVSSGDVKRPLLNDAPRKITSDAVRDSSTTLLPVSSILVVTRSGILRKYLPVAKNTVPLAINQDIKALIPNETYVSDYLLHLLQWSGPRVLASCLKAGTTVESVEFGWLKSFPVPVPPTRTEQRAIAEALADADALIGSLEQLVAKKRDIKQGAMQSLLRPELKDEVRPLGDVSSLKGRIGWQGLKQTEFTTNGDEPFLITGMNFKDGAIRWSEVYHISNARYEMAPEIQLRRNDVLMTKDGTIGKVLYIDTIPHPGKASLNSHLLLFRPIGGSYDPRYLYYQLSSQRFGDFVEVSKSGTTFFGLSQAAVAAYPVVLPPMSRQVRIAAVLSDMDTEIAALEAKLTKATRLKQGMMQELLTGKLRLV